MKTKNFIWESTVRDYELDSQGIVNHATYVNYLEQCRNDYARSLGIDFHLYYKAGYNLVITGIDIQYRFPLQIKDVFYVTAKLSNYDRKRMFFEQEIRLKLNDKLIVKAFVTAACVDQKTGKSCMPNMLKENLDLIS